jgi:hypothetical protein
MWMSSTTFRARGRRAEMANFTIRLRSRREQLCSGSGASSRNSLCATDSNDGFGSSMGTSSRSAVSTKLHQGGINRNSGQPGCKLGSSIKILETDESIQKALLRCVFRVFTVSCDPASHTGDSFHMTLAKLSEGISFAHFWRLRSTASRSTLEDR